MHNSPWLSVTRNHGTKARPPPHFRTRGSVCEHKFPSKFVIAKYYRKFARLLTLSAYMNSFTQQYIMAVFGVKYRLGLINRAWADNLYALMGSILKEIDGVMPLIINGYKDHVHVLYSTKGVVADAEIVRRLKTESSRWINEQRLTRGRFEWQRGGARISYSPSALPNVKAYIANQWEHHRVKTFREEYEQWLVSMGVNPNTFDLPENPQ